MRKPEGQLESWLVKEPSPPGVSVGHHALRVALVNVPAWQLALAVVFLLGGIYVLFHAGARLYENAVLHSGARLRLREAWRGEPARSQPAQR